MKKTYQYAIACPTSMGVRITPPERMAVQNSNLFYMPVSYTHLTLPTKLEV